jgi:hypothetical protein
MGKYKTGIEYFSHDTDMSTADKGLELVEAEYGIKAYALYLKLLERIYGEKGYYIEWDEDSVLLFAKRLNEDGDLVSDIVDALIKRGLFNRTVYEDHKVLTSESIQTRYIDAAKRRSKVQLQRAYLLVDPDVYSEHDNVDIKGENVSNTTENLDNGSEDEADEPDSEGDDDQKYSDRFDAFWELYDIKKGKKKAWLEWKNLTETDKEKIMENVPIFLTHFSSKQYTPRPRKYLYNRYWEDEDYQKPADYEQSPSKQAEQQIKNAQKNRNGHNQGHESEYTRDSFEEYLNEN